VLLLSKLLKAGVPLRNIIKGNKMTTAQTTKLTSFTSFINSMNESINTNLALVEETSAMLNQAGAGSAQGCIYSLFLANGKSEANFSSGVVKFSELYPDYKALNLKEFKEIKTGLLLKGLAPRTIDNYKSRFNRLLNALHTGQVKKSEAVRLSHAGIAELSSGVTKALTAKVYLADTVVIKGVTCNALAQKLGVDCNHLCNALTVLAEEVLRGVATPEILEAVSANTKVVKGKKITTV
jgi:hypothetical protein